MIRLYMVLARVLLPASFLDEYGAEVEAAVTARLRAARSGGARCSLLAREGVDLIRTAIRERWWRETPARSGPARGLQRLETVFRDVRHAVRQMRRAPGFTAVVIVTLSLGIGLNTAVFSGVHGVLLRPPAGVEAPERLVRIYRTWDGIEHGANSIPHYRDVRDRTAALFDGVAAWSFVSLGLGSGAGSDVVIGQMVSANFFDVLGVRAQIGRTFLPDEAEGVGAHPVVVLGHDTWRTRFGADPGIVGRTAELNGTTFEVIGVAPEGFRGAEALFDPALWAPLSMQPQLQPGRADRLENRNSNFMSVIARMKPGVTVERARAEMRTVLDGLRREHPTVYERSGVRVIAQERAGLRASYGGAADAFATLLLAVVGLLLLLACANVANLMLARAEHRRREMAIRLSIGASRGRILQQLLTESVLHAMLAGAAGIGLAALAIRALEGIEPATPLPLDLRLELSAPVLLFTLVVALGTAVASGLVPALYASRARSSEGLGRAATSAAASRLTPALVALQTTLAVVLLLSAALFLRSLVSATRIDPGFGAAHLLSVRVHPDLVGRDRVATETLLLRLAEELRSDPRITGVTWTDIVPLSQSDQSTRVVVSGSAGRSGDPSSLAFARVGPGYFETMGITVQRGRGITDADRSGTPGAVVVNRTMADRFWPGADPIGRIVETQGEQRIVVGIAADGKYETLGEAPVPFMYLALAQDFRADVTIVVRTAGDPAALAPDVERTIRDVDPLVPIRSLRTMENQLATSLLPARLAAGALGLFAVLGLLLAALGIHGVIAHGVSRRTREIGIRLALGARPAGVHAMLLARGARLTLPGLAAGLLLSLLATRTVRSLVYTVQPIDPVTWILVPALLAAVALIATWIPARRAARIDPVQAVKGD